jgi:hypothetical protein
MRRADLGIATIAVIAVGSSSVKRLVRGKPGEMRGMSLAGSDDTGLGQLSNRSYIYVLCLVYALPLTYFLPFSSFYLLLESRQVSISRCLELTSDSGKRQL